MLQKASIFDMLCISIREKVSTTCHAVEKVLIIAALISFFKWRFSKVFPTSFFHYKSNYLFFQYLLLLSHAWYRTFMFCRVFIDIDWPLDFGYSENSKTCSFPLPLFNIRHHLSLVLLLQHLHFFWISWQKPTLQPQN